MPDFEITDPQSGQVYTVSGEVAPTEQDKIDLLPVLRQSADVSNTEPPAPPVQESPSMVERAGNLAMEGVTAVNRAGASTIDIATAPLQYLANKIGLNIPTLRSTVPEKGAFAGQSLATDFIAAGGELGTLALTGGGATRALASGLDEVARYGENALRGVLRSLGATTPRQDAAYGAFAGMGAEAGGDLEEMFTGQRSLGELAGGVLLPAVWTTTTTAIRDIGRNFLAESVPNVNQIRGVARALYTKLDEANIVANRPSSQRLINDVNEFIKDEGEAVLLTLPQLNAKIRQILSVAESGKLTYSYLDRSHAQLMDIGKEVGFQGTKAKELGKMLDEFIINLTPSNPSSLGDDTIASTVRDARSFWRRASVVETVEDAFAKASIQSDAGRSNPEMTLRRTLGTLLKNDRKTQFFTDSEKRLMREVIAGGRMEKTLELIGKLAPNSEDWVKLLIGGSVVSAVSGTMSVPAAVGTITGVSLLEASKVAANKLFKRNAEFMVDVLKAGQDGQRVVQSYLKHTPRERRRPGDLTALLLQNRADLSALRDSSSSGSRLVSDAIVLGLAGENIIRQEQQRASNETR